MDGENRDPCQAKPAGILLGSIIFFAAEKDHEHSWRFTKPRHRWSLSVFCLPWQMSFRLTTEVTEPHSRNQCGKH